MQLLRRFNYTTGALKKMTSFSIPRLESIVKLDRFREQDLDSDTISNIWSAHFSTKENTSALSMPSNLADLLKERISKYPTFILPVPKLTGHEIVLLESIIGGDNNFAVQITGLEEYKRIGPTAPSRASFTFFTDLQREKGVVLILNRFDGNYYNLSQASQLLQNFCAAYTQDDLFKWVKLFTETPNNFDFESFYKTFTSTSTFSK